MLLLPYDNLLVKTIISEAIENESVPAAIDQVVSDFDNVTFHISTPETKTKILVSMYIKCYPDLEKYGVEKVLQREYGKYIVESEPGYNFSLLIDLENLPETAEERVELAEKVALLRRNAMAAPFEQAFDRFDELAQEASNTNVDLYAPTKDSEPVLAIHYRPHESIYIQPSYDRVTVHFSTLFRDDTDRVLGKIFLQEFVDARKRAIQNAPQVLYSSQPPPELRSAGAKDDGGETGYITFVLFPRHLIRGERREKCISHVMVFRDYFQYHIKCSKAYMHTRMRYRVAEFLKVLNRAKPENVEKERKTASGRKF